MKSSEPISCVNWLKVTDVSGSISMPITGAMI
jgi:hypothetical protein